MWSERSLRNLSTAHRALQVLFTDVNKVQPCEVLEGHRGKEKQDLYYKQKKSKLPWPLGKHNKQPSWAVDVAPLPIDWNDGPRFHSFAKFVFERAKELKIDLRWGGDWDRDGSSADESFLDLVHFELVTEPLDNEALLQYASAISLARPNAVSLLQKLNLWVSDKFRRKPLG